MGWFRSLFGIKETNNDPMEILKQIARENTAREREKIERTARLSTEEIAKFATRLRTLDGMGMLYNSMRRDDFCDAVMVALKTGNLSEEESSLVMYVREWVVSSGEKRLSFPEWLAAEGKNHFLFLNHKWLTSGVDRRMTFRDWYVNVKSDL